MLPAGGRPATSWVHYTTICNTQSSAPEDGQNNSPKHVEMTGIINKSLLLHLVGCLYYLYKWCTVMQISENEIYLLITYIKSVLCRVGKGLFYIQDARCLSLRAQLSLCFKFTVNLLKGTKGETEKYTKILDWNMNNMKNSYYFNKYFSLKKWHWKIRKPVLRVDINNVS